MCYSRSKLLYLAQNGLLMRQEELCREYASFFQGKTKEELDELAKSFALSKWRLGNREL